jgi:23S rRNA A1618 N6-methylase RlmF
LIEKEGKVTIDWRDEEAIKELTIGTILKEYQGKVLNYSLPKGYLCPRVPQRKAYINWIK